MRLQILIPGLKSRTDQRILLLCELYTQMKTKNINEIDTILIDVDDGEKTIGRKRNNLLRAAKADYVCFVDDDDWIAPDYIAKIMKGLESNPDCLSLTGIMTTNGQNPEKFVHSIRYKEYRTNESGPVKYERYPNHLNVIKREIAQQFRFPEINHGEDTDWATQVFKSGLLKNEVFLPGVQYYYQFNPNK